MKGLLYKDYLVLRKQLWSMLLLVAVFCFIPNDTSFFNLGLFFVVYTSLLPVSLLAFDERAHWDKLAPMLPVTRREIVQSKYLMGLFLALGAGILYFAGRSLHGTAAAGQALSAVAMALIFQAVLYPLLFRYGVEKGRLAMGGMTAVIVFLCLQFDFLPEGTSSYGEAVSAAGSPVLLLVSVVLLLVSVRISERQYARRLA